MTRELAAIELHAARNLITEFALDGIRAYGRPSLPRARATRHSPGAEPPPSLPEPSPRTAPAAEPEAIAPPLPHAASPQDASITPPAGPNSRPPEPPLTVPARSPVPHDELPPIMTASRPPAADVAEPMRAASPPPPAEIVPLRPASVMRQEDDAAAEIARATADSTRQPPVLPLPAPIAAAPADDATPLQRPPTGNPPPSSPLPLQRAAFAPQDDAAVVPMRPATVMRQVAAEAPLPASASRDGRAEAALPIPRIADHAQRLPHLPVDAAPVAGRRNLDAPLEPPSSRGAGLEPATHSASADMPIRRAPQDALSQAVPAARVASSALDLAGPLMVDTSVAGRAGRMSAAQRRELARLEEQLQEARRRELRLDAGR